MNSSSSDDSGSEAMLEALNQSTKKKEKYKVRIFQGRKKQKINRRL